MFVACMRKEKKRKESDSSDARLATFWSIPGEKKKKNGRGGGRFTLLLCCHLFQSHCPMAASLICPITEEDYDVLCFLPMGSLAGCDSCFR